MCWKDQQRIQSACVFNSCKRRVWQRNSICLGGVFWVLYHSPIGSMYGIFTYIYHKNQPNVGKYTLHGSCGSWCTNTFQHTAREPLQHPHHPWKKTAKFAIQVADAANPLQLRFAGHRKWAGAYALSKRGLEKLTKSGYAQCTLVKGYIWTLGIYKMKIVVTIVSVL